MSVWIRVRLAKDGRRYQVIYRRFGRGSIPRSAGTFKKKAQAMTRRDIVGGWLAAGLDPGAELAKIKRAAPVRRDYNAWADAYERSRIDIGEQHRVNVGSHLRRLRKLFGERDPLTLTVADQIEAVGELSAKLKPSSVARYWATHRLVLDFAGADPNTARDKSVKLPTIEHTEIVPPTAEHLLTMLDAMPRRWRLALITSEQTGMTVGELETLEWGDVDVAGSRFRLRRKNVKAQIRARARWIQVPEWLMGIIEDTCPPEDRLSTRRVYPGFTGDAAKNAMARSCKAAGIPHYSPHELRHRRLSLWHGQGVPAKQLAERAGHSKASMTLDTYSHVMPLDEAPISSLRALLVVTG